MTLLHVFLCLHRPTWKYQDQDRGKADTFSNVSHNFGELVDGGPRTKGEDNGKSIAEAMPSAKMKAKTRAEPRAKLLNSRSRATLQVFWGASPKTCILNELPMHIVRGRQGFHGGWRPEGCLRGLSGSCLGGCLDAIQRLSGARISRF